MQPQTRAEATSYAETSLHADVMTFLAALDARRDPRFHLTSFGVSPGGRELPLVVVSAHGIKTPAASRARGLPVVLVINGIHAGEVEGKEASMMLLRDILDGTHADLVAQLTLVVVPLFNPDGNDAIDPANRELEPAAARGADRPGPGRHPGQQVGHQPQPRLHAPGRARDARCCRPSVVQVWEPDLTIDMPRDQRLGAPVRDDLRHPAHGRERPARADRVHARADDAGGHRGARGRTTACSPAGTATSSRTSARSTRAATPIPTPRSARAG